MIIVTLVYEDETRFIVGGFPDMDAANRWINEEQTRPYWNPSTQIETVNDEE